ncbi:hypothetical protein [Roseomonas sp. BN140053]|uniref:hypothetical protein n=1 Tax=Roseomonas sp. BN140053 TaxID=3391898 RepID=UPI0039E807F4
MTTSRTLRALMLAAAVVAVPGLAMAEGVNPGFSARPNLNAFSGVTQGRMTPMDHSNSVTDSGNPFAFSTTLATTRGYGSPMDHNNSVADSGSLNLRMGRGAPATTTAMVGPSYGSAH